MGLFILTVVLAAVSFWAGFVAPSHPWQHKSQAGFVVFVGLALFTGYFAWREYQAVRELARLIAPVPEITDVSYVPNPAEMQAIARAAAAVPGEGHAGLGTTPEQRREFAESVQGLEGRYCYFSVPLARALDIYQAAFRRMSGIGRTARGPVMSAHPGKVLVQGVTRIAGQKVFVLSMIQARELEQAGRVFFARYDPRATWLTELRPLSPESGHIAAGHILSTDRHSGLRRQPVPRVRVSSTERQTP